MIKVRCVDNENAERFLDKGRIYKIKHESDVYYFMAHDDRNWLKARFEVVKDEEQMTHRQKMKELLPIIQAYCDGAVVECYSEHLNIWYNWEESFFNSIYQYRIKQTPDTIDWSHVHEGYKWMARNMNGRAYFHTRKPEKKTTRFNSMHSAAVSQASYKQGTVSWENSLVERPEGV